MPGILTFSNALEQGEALGEANGGGFSGTRAGNATLLRHRPMLSQSHARRRHIAITLAVLAFMAEDPQERQAKSLASSAPAEPVPGAISISVAELDDIERRQDEILRELDGLNDRILAVLRENGVKVPTPPANLRFGKAA